MKSSEIIGHITVFSLLAVMSAQTETSAQPLTYTDASSFAETVTGSVTDDPCGIVVAQCEGAVSSEAEHEDGSGSAVAGRLRRSGRWKCPPAPRAGGGQRHWRASLMY